jgi:hypothetical protein
MSGGSWLEEGVSAQVEAAVAEAAVIAARTRWDAAMDLLSERWGMSREAAARMIVVAAGERGVDPIDLAERVISEQRRGN